MSGTVYSSEVQPGYWRRVARGDEPFVRLFSLLSMAGVETEATRLLSVCAEVLDGAADESSFGLNDTSCFVYRHHDASGLNEVAELVFALDKDHYLFLPARDLRRAGEAIESNGTRREELSLELSWFALPPHLRRDAERWGELRP